MSKPVVLPIFNAATEIANLLRRIADVIVAEDPAVDEAIETLRVVDSYIKGFKVPPAIPATLAARIAAAVTAVDCCEDAAVAVIPTEHSHD